MSINSKLKKAFFSVFAFLAIVVTFYLARFSWAYARSHIFHKSNFLDGRFQWHNLFANKNSWLIFLCAMLLIVVSVLIIMFVGAALNKAREKVKKIFKS